MVTNKQVISMHEGLSELGKRFLPSTPSDIRVARLKQLVEPVATPLIRGRARIASDVMEAAGVAEGEKITGLLAQSLMAKIIEKQFEFDSQECEFAVPEKKLSQSDLPKERAGDNGWQNAAGLGDIISSLGPLFDMPKDE
jgi:hypothetical protein